MVERESAEIEKAAEKVIQRHAELKRQVKRDRKELKQAVQSLADAETAQSILQMASKHVQDQVHKQLSLIVTKCLKAVFPRRPYTFEIRFETKRGRTDAKMVFMRDGHKHSARSGIGGSVLEVAAFALQLGCLMIQEPAKRRVLILDEPMRTLSSVSRDRAAAMLEMLSKEMGLQIILTTHSEEFKVGQVIEI